MHEQVLVYHDLLGMMQHPHHAKVTPKFCKQYGNVGVEIERALGAFNAEVKNRAFPGPAFSPYKIPGQPFLQKLFQTIETQSQQACILGYCPGIPSLINLMKATTVFSTF